MNRIITITFLLAAVLVTTCPGAEALRGRIELDGKWLAATTRSGSLTPPAKGWEEVAVPGTVRGEAKGGSEYRWYRRQVEIPAAWQGKRVFLRLNGARYDAHVFVDGRFIENRLEGWTPYEVELTKFVKPGGTHRLEVRCQDWGATFYKGFTLPKQVDGELRHAPKGNIIAPIGGHFAFYGIWDTARLEARPPSYLHDVAIESSVREKTLGVRGRLAPLRGKMTVTGYVYDGNKSVLTLPAATVSADGSWQLTAPFPTARYWSPEDPHLYRLRLVLRTADGEVIDDRLERFGFREIWAKGPDIYFNGVKRHLLATSTWPKASAQPRAEIRRTLERIKQGNNIAFRMHTQPWRETWLEEADEVGILMIEEGALWCDFGGGYGYDKPLFWENVHEHLAGMVRRDRNHASLVMWSIENEILHCGCGKFGGDCEARLVEAGEMVKRLDPTHLITYEADLDPGGIADVIGLHYPHEAPQFFDYPNTCDWLERGTTLGTEGALAGSWNARFKHRKDKPLYIGEYLWIFMQDYSTPTIFYGDEAYIDREKYHALAKGDAWYDQTLAYRRAGVAGLCPWAIFQNQTEIHDHLWGVQKTFYEPVAAFIRERDTRFHAGDSVTRRADVFNDSVKTLDLSLAWQLAGTSLAGRQNIRLEPGGHGVLKLSLALPASLAAGEYKLSLGLFAVGKKLHAAEQTLAIAPRRALRTPKGVRLLLYDPKGAWRDRIIASGLTLSPIDSLGVLAKGNAATDIVIIAPASLRRKKVDMKRPVVGSDGGESKILIDFLVRGGKALVMEQENLGGIALGLTLVEHASTMTFPADPNHSLWQGLKPDDLKFWRGDNYVSKYEMRRPVQGGARALAVSGGNDELDQGPVVLMPVGKGAALFVQMLVGAKLGKEPAARRILENGLALLAKHKPSKAKTAALSGDKTFLDALDRLGLDYARDATAGGNLLILHGGGIEITGAAGAIASFLTSGKGKTLYWHSPEPRAFKQLRGILGAKSLAVMPASGPLALKKPDGGPLAALLREDILFRTPNADWYREVSPDPGVIESAIFPDGTSTKGTRLEAEKMALTGTYVSAQGEVVSFATNGTATTKVDIPADGLRQLTIIAGGTPCEKVYPVIKVSLDGEEVGRVALSQGEMKPYSLLAEMPRGRHKLTLAFVNDRYQGGEDRNLKIDAAIISADTWRGSEMQLVTMPAALVQFTPPANAKNRVIIDCIRWDRNDDNSVRAGRYASTLLGELGASFKAPHAAPDWVTAAAFELVEENDLFKKTDEQLAYPAPAEAEASFECSRAGDYSLFLLGRSTPALGTYAIAELKVDGKVVGETELRSPSAREFAVGKVRLAAGKHTVSVRFTNDKWVEGKEDRNLYVNAVGFLLE